MRKTDALTLRGVVLLAAAALSACSWVVSRSELRAEPKYLAGTFETEAPFTRLAHCFAEQGPKMRVDFKDVTRVEVYSDIGLAHVVYGQDYGVYGIIDLARLDENRTKVTGYGTGATVKDFIFPALDFLRSWPSNCVNLATGRPTS